MTNNMKKSLNLIVLLIVSLLLTNCKKNEIVEEIEEENAIEINVFYKTSNKTYPDIDCKLYIYNNIIQTDVMSYELSTNGVLYNSYKPTEKIYPDSIATADMFGLYRHDIDKTLEKIFIIVESNNAYIGERKMTNTISEAYLQESKRVRKYTHTFINN